MKITVLGASGGIGNAITRELAAREHTVVAVNRAGDAVVPAGVERRAGDLTTPHAAERAIGDADVVVMAAQPPYPRWVAQWPGLMENVLAGAEATGGRLVFVDNLYMYAPADAPITEHSPQHATDPKGVVRRVLGETLLDTHAKGRASISIGRFSDYYGPGGTNSALYVMGIRAGLRGRTMRGLVDLDQPHTFHYVADAARGFATLVEDARADGQTWVLPAAPPTTQRRLLELINTHLPKQVGIGVVTPFMLRIGGLFDPMIRETRSVAIQWDRPWIVDASNFTSTFGPIGTTPHEAAVAETMAWFRTNDSGRMAATRR